MWYLADDQGTVGTTADAKCRLCRRLAPSRADLAVDLGHDLLDDVERLVEQGFGDVQRGLDFDQVAESGVAALAEEHAACLGPPDNLTGGLACGLMVCWSRTTSKHTMSPGERTSPMIELRSCRARSRCVACSPCLAASVGRSSAMIACTAASPAAMESGNCPKVSWSSPAANFAWSVPARTPASGKPPPTPLPNTSMSGCRS